MIDGRDIDTVDNWARYLVKTFPDEVALKKPGVSRGYKFLEQYFYFLKAGNAHEVEIRAEEINSPNSKNQDFLVSRLEKSLKKQQMLLVILVNLYPILRNLSLDIR